MKKILTNLLIVSTFILLASVPTASEAASCPFTEGTDNYVVKFPSKVLFSDQGAANSSVTAKNVNIPVGTYEISGAAYDSHSTHGGQGQTLERYFIQFKKADGKNFKSGSTKDIPENKDTVSSVISKNAVVDVPITTITAVHAGYPGNGKWQSVYPTCVQFKKVTSTTTNNLQATCTVSKTNPNIGESVTYSAQVTNGTGTLMYTWSGAFNSTNQNHTLSYSSAGTYNANLTVKDGNNNTVNATCPTVTVQTSTNTLDGSCTISPSVANVGQSISFNASASGGTGSYTYSWNGSDGITSSSQSFTGSFGNSGNKSATVTITSGGQSITRSCSVYVQPSTNTATDGYCYGTPSGNGIMWYAYVNPNYGGYTYSWTGSDNMYGTGNQYYMSYPTNGQKNATVTITGNGQSIVRTCSASVYQNVVPPTYYPPQTYNPQPVYYAQPTYNPQPTYTNVPTGTPVSGVFLNQVPDTGISFGLKVTLFSLGLILWSIFGAYMINKKVRLQTTNGVSLSKAELFKMKNMAKRGIVR